MPNGCCQQHADGPGHNAECYTYWPCGHPKERDASLHVLPHVHEAERWEERGGAAVKVKP